MSQLADGSSLVMPCPCQPAKAYQACCAPYHDGKPAPTADALMRSRYSAYILNKAVYLYRSWSAQTRPSKKSLKKAKPLDWLGLEIIHTERGNLLDDSGIVEFIANYQNGDRVAQLHEVSRFVRENGHWVYVAGTYK